MRPSKLRLDCDHWLTSKSSMNSNSPFALPPNSDWGLQPETSCCQVPQVHLRKRCCLRRWVQRGACHFLLMLTEDLKYLEILEALSQEQMVLCLLMLWAQDMKDGKGRLICDGIGTLAEADSTLADCLTNKRFHLDARYDDNHVCIIWRKAVQIWSNLTAKIWPANASIKSGYVFPLFSGQTSLTAFFSSLTTNALDTGQNSQWIHSPSSWLVRSALTAMLMTFVAVLCRPPPTKATGKMICRTYKFWAFTWRNLLPKVPITTYRYHLLLCWVWQFGRGIVFLAGSQPIPLCCDDLWWYFG